MRQKAGAFVRPSGNSLNYLLFLPKAYGKNGAKKWPLIFFLHGAGERGNDPLILKRHGIPRIAEERPDFPFVAVSPQCPEGSTWNHHLRSLDLLLEDIQKNYVVDPARLYLTGISIVGNGVWLMAVRHPERFAAVAPICGYGLPSQAFPDRACALKDVPVWVFHGAEGRHCACFGIPDLSRYPQRLRREGAAHNLPRNRPRFLDAHL